MALKPVEKIPVSDGILEQIQTAAKASKNAILSEFVERIDDLLHRANNGAFT